MLTITLDPFALDDLIKEITGTNFDKLDEQSRLKIQENTEDLFWSCLTTALDSSSTQGVTLSEIYTYTRVKKLLDERKNKSDNFIVISEADLPTIIKYFSEYKGWNPQVAPIIIHMDKTLKGLQNDT